MKHLFLIFLTTMLAARSMAATVSISVSSNAGPMFTTSGGGVLSLGSVIRVGIFDLSGGNLATLQNSNDYNAINALFTPLAESGAPSGTVTQANNSGSLLIINDMFGSGNVLGEIANIEAAYLAAGQQLFTWVFNSDTPETASEWGIYSATSGWNFPNSLGSETLASFEVDTVLRGGYTGTLGSLTSSDKLMLSPVPEPGSLLLILGSVLTFSLRRSRRR